MLVTLYCDDTDFTVPTLHIGTTSNKSWGEKP